MDPGVAGDADALRRRNRELTILKEIAESLNATIELNQSLDVTLASVAEWLGLRTGWIWLLDPVSEEPILAAARDLPPGLADHPARMEGWCYCLRTFRDGDLRGAANVNVVTCSRLQWLREGTGGLRFHASVPLYAHGRKVGVLNVASAEGRELSPEELRLLHTVGDMLGIAVERARLYERSQEAGAVEERNRLAREIHDTLAQGLSAIALRLDAIDALLETGAERERVATLIAEALDITRANLEETRRTVLDLRAAPLEGRTVAEALRDLVAGDPDVQLAIDGADRGFPARIEAGLFRIAQELIANARRHAGASAIRVRLHADRSTITLTVEDDGRGFDTATPPAGHFGLVGINERVRLLDGRISIDSSPDSGTRAVVIVPIDASDRPP